MLTIDLGIFWEWEYDRDFVLWLDSECRKAELSSYLVYPANFEETLEKVQCGDLAFRHVLDRASDVHEGFAALAPVLQQKGTVFVNPPDRLADAIDKAVMHPRLIEAGIEVPYTIMLNAFNDDPVTRLHPGEMERVKRPFIIKPAQGGGGVGVVLGAKVYCDVVKARAENCGDRYLVQEEIAPELHNGRRGWFRVFYVHGDVIPCWWDDRTKLFSPMSHQEREDPSLAPIGKIMHKIAALCGLGFFSSEIAKCSGERFVAIDYVNDICDMRLGSLHRDGVPDEVVREIISSLIKWIKNEDRRRLHPSS